MRSGRLRFVCALALGIASIPRASSAQEPSVMDSLTVKDCVEIALRNNADIINARYNVDIQDMNLQSAKGNLLPTINSSYGASKSITGPRAGQFPDPVTGQIITSIGQSTISGSQSVGTNMSIPVYNAGTLANISASRAGLRSSQQTLENTRLSTVRTVKQQFYQVFQAQKQLALAGEAVRTAEESLRRAQTMYEIGSVAVADVLTARSNLETKKVAVITQEQAVDIARSNLAFTLGLDVNQPIRLKEELLTAKPVGMTYEQALRRAFDRRPDLKARRFGLEQSRRQLDETRAGMRRPTVSMSAGYSWGTQNTPFRGIEDLFLQNYSYSFGLSVSMPIFNGMRTENSIRQRKLQFQQTQDLLRRDERQVALSVKQATLNVARYIQQIDAQNEAVKAAEEDFRLAEERYNFGAGTILERLQAQERLFTAKNNYINAIYNYYQELASLEAAVGGLDPE